MPAVIADGEWDVTHLQHALEHAGQMGELGRAVIRKFSARFVTSDIERAIRALPVSFLTRQDAREQLESIRIAGRSAYLARFPAESELSQRVLLSAADEERQGMEDARFVQIVADDGETEYRATHTVYDGRSIASRLLITRDFVSFSVHRLTGAGAHEGDGAVPATHRRGLVRADPQQRGATSLDRISGRPRHWIGRRAGRRTAAVAGRLVQIGNCGSPIETPGRLAAADARRRSDAVLRDRRHAARSRRPDRGDRGALPRAAARADRRRAATATCRTSSTRCGALAARGRRWSIPYGIGDQHIRVASVPLDALLDAMVQPG